MEPGTRVRPADERAPSKEHLRDGTGTVIRMEGDIPVIGWDQYGGRFLLVREDPKTLVAVDPKCSYAKVQWKRGAKWGIEGMVVVCDVHGMPANGDVYGCDPEDIPAITGLCSRFPEV